MEVGYYSNAVIEMMSIVQRLQNIKNDPKPWKFHHYHTIVTVVRDAVGTSGLSDTTLSEFNRSQELYWININF